MAVYYRMRQREGCIMLDVIGALRSKLAWPALLLLLCTGFYWRLLFTDQYSFLESPDLVNMELPRLQFQATEWRHARFPLWNPHLWCGQPFLGQFTGAAYPPNWPLALLPFEQGTIRRDVLHWYFVLIHFQGALFAYWLCRDLKRSRAASLAAGLVFSFGGFVGSTGWPQVLNGAVWAPAVLLFLLRAVRGERAASSAALSGACLGMAWLSGHHEVPIYLTLAAAGAWIYYVARGAGSRRRLAGLAALALLLTVLVSGLQTVPGYEYGKLARRWAGPPDPVAWNQPVPYSVHESYSLPPASLLGLVLPGRYWHVDPFVGVAALTLALLAVAAAWKQHPEVRLLAVLALAALLFAMAAQNVFHGMLYAWAPLAGKARVPARAVVIFNLAVAPLAAFGLDAVREAAGSFWLKRAVWLLAAVALGVFGVAGVMALTGRYDPQAAALWTGLTAALLAALLAGWRAQALSGRALAVSLVLLCLLELGAASGANWPNLKDPNRTPWLTQLRAHDDVASYLRAQPGPVRVAVNDKDVPYNFGDWHGIDTLEGYVAGVTASIFALGTHRPQVQDLLAVNYAVSHQPTRPGQELVFSGASGVNVYRNPGALPRARIVHELAPAPSPPLERCEGGQVEWVTQRPSEVALKVAAGCRSMLVLADTAFPGWHARVDGRPAPIIEVYGALRGVVVEGGAHLVEMTYFPVSALLGGAMTLLGLLGVVVLRRL